MPVIVVAVRLFEPSDGVWQHLADTVLVRYIGNTAALMVGVGIGVSVVGVGTAWLVTMCRFPGSTVLRWALLLPLAVPTYIIGYTYTDLLQFAGPLQTAMRSATGWGRADYWFPEIRSLGGVIAVMTAVLYPYVYLLARSAFLAQSVCVLEVSRTLGRGPLNTFAKVALPLARPAIIAGVALALMEVLADFGTVQYFGVDTFTTGIYRTWFALGNPVAAAQLAAMLMLCVLTVLLLERWTRGSRRYHQTTTRERPLPSYELKGWRAALALVFCSLPPMLGFAVPALVLSLMTLRQGDDLLGPQFLSLAGSSFSLALITAAVVTAAGLVIAYGARIAPSALIHGASRVAGMGYAVPGSVIAVGILVPFTQVDNAIDAAFRGVFGVGTGLLITGTIAALVFAYLVRFLAVGLGTMESGFGKISPSMDGVARTLGRGSGRTLLEVHLPMLRGSLLTAAILVFVEVMKELPATLIVRPFNFETLAVRVYRFAADERLAEASTAALAIVAVGILPVILLSRAISTSRVGSAAPGADLDLTRSPAPLVNG